MQQTQPVTLHPAMPEDDDFLLAVYASTRVEELAVVPWSDEQKWAFVQMQAHAQRQHYTRYYPDALWSVILSGQDRVGRLIVNRADDEILLMDIALLPPYRGAGIGTGLIQDLIAEAKQTGKTVRLHVETFNPAMHLYERLGFVQTKVLGDGSVYVEMQWRATLPGKGENLQ